MNLIYLSVAFLLLVMRFDSTHATESYRKIRGSGEDVVRKAVGAVEDCLGSTNNFLVKVAYVESKFGKDNRTYREGNL